MSHFLEMDWNSKWDWESFAAFGSKTTENPKKLLVVDRTIIDDRETDAGSFNLSTGGGNSGASGSDGGHVSSAKSSISASESSTKDGQTPDFRLMTYDGFSGNFSNNTEMEGIKVSGTSPPLEASMGSVESLIGLKLGKRTYFENSGAGGHAKSSSSTLIPTSYTTSLKKTKSPGQSLPMARCVVEGCNIDLSMAKDYHRKHRVCDIHSKSPKVVVGGLERRFCQQCSRFHNLSEFDDKKRSCRRRLSDHNARRRKPQHETIQFNSSPFYGGSQQMSFLSNAPLLHSRNLADATWDSTCNSKFTLTKGCPLKSIGDGISSEQMHTPRVEYPYFLNMRNNVAKVFPASKSSVADVSNSGSKGSSHFTSHIDEAPEYHRRALSLLSTNSWASSGAESMHINPIHENDNCVGQAMMHGMPEGVPVPLSSAEFWQPGHQSTHPRIQPMTAATTTTNSNFQETQLFFSPYETDLYSNIMS